jgi:hypothetical protein
MIIMVPYLCVMVGFHSHIGMDTTNGARVWKDRSREGTATQQRNRHNFSVDTHRSSVLSCRLLTTIEGQSSVRAQHTRGRRRPLGPEGLATLALRKLNRQPTGVLALNYTTCRRAVETTMACGLSQSLYVKRDRRRSRSVCKSGQKQARDPLHRHHA